MFPASLPTHLRLWLELGRRLDMFAVDTGSSRLLKLAGTRAYSHDVSRRTRQIEASNNRVYEMAHTSQLFNPGNRLSVHLSGA